MARSRHDGGWHGKSETDEQGSGGKMNGMLDGRTATKEEVGYLMTNLKEENDGKEE